MLSSQELGDNMVADEGIATCDEDVAEIYLCHGCWLELQYRHEGFEMLDFVEF